MASKSTGPKELPSRLTERLRKRAASLAGSALTFCMPPFILKWLLESALTRLNSRGESYFTFWPRPKHCSGLTPARFPLTPDFRGRAAIVVQGPLALENDFTLETLAWYGRAFPESPLILSTWDDADAVTLERARALGVHVITSHLPQLRGPCNLNLQVLSTLQGVLKARELNATHVLKTRADQRMYSPSAMRQLSALQQTFPLENGGSQKERLLALSYTLRYVPYHLCDFLIYGQIDDMITFWSIPPDPRPAPTTPIAGRDLRGAPVPEIVLCSSFLNTTGWNLKWTVTDTWKAYRERFCLIDYETLDIYWPKGDRLSEYRNRFYTPELREMIGFLEWVSLWQLGLCDDGDVDALMNFPMNHSNPQIKASLAAIFGEFPE